MPQRDLDEAFALAARREESGNRDRAIALLEGLLASGHDGARARFLLASLHDDRPEGQSRAVEHYRQGLALDPADAAARNNLAVALMATGRADEAIAELSTVLTSDPSYGLAAHNLARLAGDQLTDEQLTGLLSRIGGAQGGSEALVRLFRAAGDTGRQDAYETFYSAGHALKNLLGLAGSKVKSLSRRPGLEQPVGLAIADAALTIEKLYGDWTALLKAAKGKALRLVRCDLNLLAGEVVRSFAEGEQPQLTLSPAPAVVLGDPAALREVILNLARNAREAAPQGTVELRASLEPAGKFVRLAVVDDGPGIAPGHLRRIFAPGFTTKPQGSGFGLSIAERIAQSAGGRIEVESLPGRGSIFSLVLPVASETAPRLAARLWPEEFTR